MPLTQLLFTVSVLASLGYLAVAGTIAIAGALRAGGRRQDAPEGEAVLAASRLTMPVSIVVPVGSPVLAPGAIRALLDLNYPEFEVIAVVDAPAVLGTAAAVWQLEAREFFYRRTLETAPVRRIYRSLLDPRLMVVEKEPGSRGDAMNCGVNLARSRFVAVVSPEIVFGRDALLRAMTPALRDPASVVGVSTHVEHVPEDDEADARDGRVQRLRSIRAQMVTRLFWSGRPHGLGPEDGVMIWRRDAVLQANGFSADAADPELDMMFRLQQRVGGETRRFVRTGDVFGQRLAVERRLERRRAGRHQRAVLESTLAWGPGATQSVGLRAFLSFIESEVVTPLAQVWLVVSAVVGATLGWCSWTSAVFSVLALAFGTAAVSAAALLLRGSHPGAPEAAELRELLLTAPLEVLIHRPFRAWWRLSGLLSAARD